MPLPAPSICKFPFATTRETLPDREESPCPPSSQLPHPLPFPVSLPVPFPMRRSSPSNACPATLVCNTLCTSLTSAAIDASLPAVSTTVCSSIPGLCVSMFSALRRCCPLPRAGAERWRRAPCGGTPVIGSRPPPFRRRRSTAPSAWPGSACCCRPGTPHPIAQLRVDPPFLLNPSRSLRCHETRVPGRRGAVAEEYCSFLQKPAPAAPAPLAHCAHTYGADTKTVSSQRYKFTVVRWRLQLWPGPEPVSRLFLTVRVVNSSTPPASPPILLRSSIPFQCSLVDDSFASTASP